MKRRLSLCIFLSLFVAVGAACGIPRDQGNTLERVRDGVLRVGVASNEPWTVLEAGGQPAGVEVALVQELAERQNAELMWIEGAQSDLLAALSRRELDLVIGGFTAGDPALTEVALTSSYYTERFGVGVSPPAAVFRELQGREIAVKQGSELAAHLLDEDAVPRRLPQPTAQDAPVAAAEWQLAAWGLTSTGITLHDEDHVFALAPGENGWLQVLDQFLARQEAQVERLLREVNGAP